MGEGLANPTDPHHTPTIIQPSTSQPQKTKHHRKPRRKATKVPQPSDPTSVVDKAVNEEMNDSLERAATIATSLDAKQDRGNIFKTQSKATPNELGSQGTSSGGGPKVLDLETTKTTQTMKIESLKRNVKKLERRKRSRTHGLKRLYKVGLSARVESFEDKGLGEEDASKQERVADIDANEDITLVSTHDEQMFDAYQDLGGEEVFVAQQDENVVEKEVDATQIQVTTATTTPIISIDEATLAQALTELKHAKPKAKAKEIIIYEPEEFTTTTTAAIPKPRSQDKEEQQELNVEEKATLFMQLLEKKRKFFATKREEEKRNKPPTQAQQRKIMCTYLKNMEGKKLINLKNKSFDSIQKMFDRAFKRIDDDKDTAKLQQLVKIIPDEEGVAINAISLAVKPSSIVDWKIQKERKKSYYKIIRADGSSKIHLIFSHMLKDFDREDVKTLWKLVKAKYGLIRPEGDYERVLWVDLKIMFEPHIEDEVWKMQQRYKVVRWTLFNSCGVHFLSLQSGHIYMLVEKKYPLTPVTITYMLNKKLHADYFDEMRY
uniref:Uncharacterized protein n=1 Tax=Tanacetum cinerariifolium TaxID=118510 RepID=A0A699H847_TANCI|nr:hypothetical protein [Tanacetum cinerariifolium]